jgi:hypothetical protein
MNSALNYYSAAQRQSDAIRDAYRNPPLPQVDEPAAAAKKRSLLTEALGWVTQAGHRRENLLAVR